MTSSLKKNWFIYLFIPIPFIFYWYTCLPSIGLGDSVLFIHAIKQLIIKTWVNNHNVTAIWGWFFQFLPIGDIAYRGNLSCVFSSSIAICIFYTSIYLLHRCWMTAIVSSLFLMISHSVWWHGTDLADYSMNTVFVTIALYLYVKLFKTGLAKYLYILFFVCGLAVFQHYLLGSLLIGAIATLVTRLLKRKEKAWPLLWKATVCFFIGLIPWLLTFSHDVSINHSVTQTISGMLGGPFKTLFFKRPLWSGIVEYFTLLFLQFPSPYLLIIALGSYFFSRTWKLHECSVGIILTITPVVVFGLGIDTWALFAQMISTYIILAFWASFVIYWIINHPYFNKSLLLRTLLTITTIFSLVWTIYFYAHLSHWGEDPRNIWSPRFNNSYTFNYYHLNEFLANPNKKNYHDISDACHLMLAKLPPYAEYWDNDSRLFFQMKEYYQQYYHKRLDLNIQLVNSFGFPNWGSDKNTFGQRLKNAYLSGKNLFLSSLGHPFASLLANLPDKSKYQFKRFYLNDKLWVYKLITIRDANLTNENYLWTRWDFLPTDKSVLINLSLDNVLDFHEGNVFLQQDMSLFGPLWKNEDQVFFSPEKQGSSIGFLLRFNQSFKGNLTINLTTAFDAAIVEVLLNNKPLTKEPLDLYTISVSNQKFEFSNIIFENENNILSIRVIGKNDKSSDMKLGVDTIEISPAF